jgi:hypothetical protein
MCLWFGHYVTYGFYATTLSWPARAALTLNFVTPSGHSAAMRACSTTHPRSSCLL